MSRRAWARAASTPGGRCCSGTRRCCRRSRPSIGVPRQIIVAIWGLETDFGHGDMGKLPVIRTLATLAHDCRRTELFQGELLAALKIVQRGDLPLREMIGACAGEIGQTQFLPSSYIKYGVDFDGDGRVDLRHDVADVLASTANLLHTNGFKMGAPYGEGTANFEAMHEWNHAHDLPQDHRVFRRSVDGAVTPSPSFRVRQAHLSPRAGRGRSPKASGEGACPRARTLVRCPLTPTLSPQAGRGRNDVLKQPVRQITLLASNPVQPPRAKLFRFPFVANHLHH